MQKNIVLFLSDQQSAKMLSCAGNQFLKTPAIDSIVDAGVRFDRAFCTNPVCIPSRFSLFTGRYPSEIGMSSNFSQVKSIPEKILDSSMGFVLRKAGYEAYYGGKEHFPAKTKAGALGFEYICGDERDALAEHCASFLKKKPKAPFFLAVSLIQPHDICHLALSQFADSGIDLMIKNKCALENESAMRHASNPEGVSDERFFADFCPPLPDNHMPQKDEPAAVSELLEQRKFKSEARMKWTDREWRRHRWAYCRMTEELDAQVAKVLGALNESGLRENTVVIFTSDHGDHDAAHKLEHKEFPYEEAIRIPLIISDPDSTAKGVCDTESIACNGLDLLPTVCDYASAEVPPDLKGISLRPQAEGKNIPCRRDTLLVESEFGNGVRTRGFFYMLCNSGDNKEQLYDLISDPGQTMNFANLAEYRGILEKLRTDCAARKKYNKELYTHLN